MFHTSKIEKALKKAAVLHQDQRRKSDTAIPYIIHPVSVALILSRYTDDEDTLVAALLHDTVEDSEYTPEELGRDFGPRVLEIVMGVTEPKKDETGEKLPWKVRKQAYLDNLKNDSKESLLLCAADKIHNMQNKLDDYSEHGPEFLKNFNSSLEDREWYHEEILKVFKDKLDSPIVDEYERLMAESKALKI